eukprot:m.7277 g.7277  ORF g.7277 m.7277 type:complete len:57 (+) comp8778_c0_seq1:447-617(+)
MPPSVQDCALQRLAYLQGCRWQQEVQQVLRCLGIYAVLNIKPLTVQTCLPTLNLTG